MKRFSEKAIRDRLAAHYVLRYRNNGYARPDLAAAEEDVRACMKEIERLRGLVGLSLVQPTIIHHKCEQ